MDKIKQNAFWVGMAVAGIVLAAGFYLLVMEAWAEAAKLKRDILTGGTPLNRPEIPSEKDIESWKERAQKYEQDYEDIRRFYGKMDDALHAWLPGLSNPSSVEFTNALKDRIKEMESELKNAKIKIGTGGGEQEEEPLDDLFGTGPERKKETLGFNWTIPTSDQWNAIGSEADRKPIVVEMQKRYWIRKRIANVALEAGVKRIRDVRFFDKLHKELPDPPMLQQRLTYPNQPTVHRFGFNIQTSELALPDKLGKTITFGFTIDVMYGDLQKYVREFLRTDRDPKLLIDVIGLRSYVLEQNRLEQRVDYLVGKESAPQKVQEFEKSVKARPMTVMFTCRVIDFDSEAGGPE